MTIKHTTLVVFINVCVHFTKSTVHIYGIAYMVSKNHFLNKKIESKTIVSYTLGPRV